MLFYKKYKMLHKLVILSLLVILASGKPTWKDLHNYSFQQFQNDFDLNYPVSDLELRESLFSIELERVIEQNKKNLSWKDGINKFSAMTDSEKDSFKGRSKGAANLHSKSVRHSFKFLNDKLPLKSIKDLPTEVDWRTQGVVSPVKDQGHCGSCW